MAIVICDKIAEINCLLESRCVQAGMSELETMWGGGGLQYMYLSLFGMGDILF